LCDEIAITVEKTSSIKISSNRKELASDQNLIVKAARLIKDRFKLKFGFSLHLNKNIPVGSGLGGGSSNAASTLIGLNEILRLGLKKDELYELGAKLGSDVNFFLSENRFAFLKGRGEHVESLHIGKKFKHFIIWPDVSISTKKVYENSRVNPVRNIYPAKEKNKISNGAKLTKFFNNAKILQYALKKGDIFLIKRSIFNALEKSSFTVCKKLARAKEYLKDKGIFSKMTGSGSALYTISRDFSISKLKKDVPADWLIFEAETF